MWYTGWDSETGRGNLSKMWTLVNNVSIFIHKSCQMWHSGARWEESKWRKQQVKGETVVKCLAKLSEKHQHREDLLRLAEYSVCRGFLFGWFWFWFFGSSV